MQIQSVVHLEFEVAPIDDCRQGIMGVQPSPRPPAYLPVPSVRPPPARGTVYALGRSVGTAHCTLLLLLLLLLPMAFILLLQMTAAAGRLVRNFQLLRSICECRRQHQHQNHRTSITCVVFTLKRSFHPTPSAVHPASGLILHPRERLVQITTCKLRCTRCTRIYSEYLVNKQQVGA